MGSYESLVKKVDTLQKDLVATKNTLRSFMNQMESYLMDLHKVNSDDITITQMGLAELATMIEPSTEESEE